MAFKQEMAKAAKGLTAAVLVSVACVGQVRSYPLYPRPEVQREAGKIARLTGPVATVDGVDVTDKVMTFDLLPGCHVVTLLHESHPIPPAASARRDERFSTREHH